MPPECRPPRPARCRPSLPSPAALPARTPATDRRRVKPPQHRLSHTICPEIPTLSENFYSVLESLFPDRMLRYSQTKESSEVPCHVRAAAGGRGGSVSGRVVRQEAGKEWEVTNQPTWPRGSPCTAPDHLLSPRQAQPSPHFSSRYFKMLRAIPRIDCNATFDRRACRTLVSRGIRVHEGC